MTRSNPTSGRRSARSAAMLAALVVAAAASVMTAGPATAAAVSGPISSRHAIARGVTEWRESWTGAGGPEHAYLLSVDLHLASVQAASAGGYTGMLRRTSAIARGSGAVAAVNGDFFDPPSQVAFGGEVDRGHLVKSPTHGWAAQLSTHPDGTATIGPVELRGTAALLGTHSRQPLTSVNTLSDAQVGALTLLTSRLRHPVHTNRSCRYAIGRVDSRGVLRVASQSVRATSPVLSGSNEALASCSGSVRAWLRHLLRGRRVQLSTHLNQRVTSLLSGGRVIVAHGRAYDDRRGLTIPGRNPETAVCVSRDGRRLLLAVIDGRFGAGGSAGLTVAETQQFLLGNQCYSGLLLDGGGSSTLYASGAVDNHPSDFRGERAVANALLVFARR